MAVDRQIRMEGKLAAMIVRRKLVSGKTFRADGDELTNTIAALCWACEAFEQDAAKRDAQPRQGPQGDVK